jgi:uncharacterized DUF497 family protein
MTVRDTATLTRRASEAPRWRVGLVWRYDYRGTSASAGRPCVWGYTLEGIYIIVVYEEIDEDTIRVVTAYEVPESR